MSENKDAKATETAPVAAAPSKPKGGALGMIIGILVPGLLSVAGSFGGARAASHGGAAPHAEVVPAHRLEPKPPGPTVVTAVPAIDGPLRITSASLLATFTTLAGRAPSGKRSQAPSMGVEPERETWRRYAYVRSLAPSEPGPGSRVN